MTRPVIILEARPGELVEHVATRALAALQAAGGGTPCYVIHGNRRIPVHSGDTPEDVFVRGRDAPEEEVGSQVLDEDDRLLVYRAMQTSPIQFELLAGGSATPAAIAEWITALTGRLRVILDGHADDRADLEQLRTSLRGLGNLIRFAQEEAAR
jgi:hypothetical protein